LFGYLSVETLMSVEVGPFENAPWDDLLGYVGRGECTPIIGAGACYPYLPLAAELAYKWSERYNYPLTDSYDLSKTAQFMAIDHSDDTFPKPVIAHEFQDKAQPDFFKEDEPHGILADLNLPLYITTNYDYFMEEALESCGKKPVSEFCRWNETLYKTANESGIPSIFDRDKEKYEPAIGLKYRPRTEEYKPTKYEPLVYHLHGIIEIPHSLLLTENDYLDFMLRLQETDNPI
jgi:hypothetical protein